MKTVTIYTTPTCGYCKAAKAYFTEHAVSYSEKDVSVDPVAADAMIQKSGQMGVPVIVVADEVGKEQIIVGFDQPALATALGI